MALDVKNNELLILSNGYVCRKKRWNSGSVPMLTDIRFSARCSCMFIKLNYLLR